MLWFASLIFVVITAPLWLPMAVGTAAIAVAGLVAIVVIVVPPVVGALIAERLADAPAMGALAGCLVSAYYGRELWFRETGKRWPEFAKPPRAPPVVAPQRTGLADLQQAVIVQRAEQRRIEAERAAETARRAAMKEQTRRDVEQRWPEWCAKFDEAVASVNVVLNELRLPSIERATHSVSSLNSVLSQLGELQVETAVVPPTWQLVRQQDWRTGYHRRRDDLDDDSEEFECFGAQWRLDLTHPLSLRFAISDSGIYIGDNDEIEGRPFNATSVQDIADAISLEIRDDILEHGKGWAS